MRVIIMSALVLCLGLGQTVERPLSFDTQGKVTQLTPANNSKAGIFPDITDFDHIELWQSDSIVEAVVYLKDGSRRRRTVSPEELADIRAKADASIAQQVIIPRLNQEGRGRFLFEQLPLAFGWYGTSMLMIIQPSNYRIGAAVYLLSVSASYFLPMVLTSQAKMTNAQSHLSVGYGARGVLAGFLLGNILGIEGENAPRVYGLVMLPVSIGGQVLGHRLADATTLGQASLVTTYTDLGAINGLLTGLIAQRMFSKPDNYGSHPEKALTFGTLLGMVGGGTTGSVRARDWDCTEGQVIAVRTGGLLGGALLPAAYYAITGADLTHRDRAYDRVDLEVLSLLGIGGSIVGTLWTERHLHDLRLSTSGGYIVAGTTVGGAVAGGGLGFIFNTKEPEPRMVAATAAIGSVSGFFGGLALARSLQPSESARAGLGTARFEVNYAAIAGAASEYAGRRTFSAPNLLTLRF